MDNRKYNVTLLCKYTVCKTIETLFECPLNWKHIFQLSSLFWLGNGGTTWISMMSHVLMLIMELQPGSSWVWTSTKPGNSWRQIAWDFLPAPLTGIESKEGSTDFRRSLLLQPLMWRWIDSSTNVTYYLVSELQVAVSQQLVVGFPRHSP